jgi:hypothetical protein
VNAKIRLHVALAVLEEELEAVDGCGEYAIFGSASLVLRGLLHREAADVDVMVTRRVWGALLARESWHVLTPEAGNPPILARNGSSRQVLHLFYDWDDIAVWMEPERVLGGAELVRGYRCAALEEVLRHKREAVAWLETLPQNKHRVDLEAIERLRAG